MSTKFGADHSYISPTSKINFKREFTESDLFATKNHYPVDIDVSAIQSIMHIPDKANEIAVAVIDYNMPEMNGIEICKKIKNMPCKKILLTGEATHEKAVEAFNNGLIDKFIKKNHGMANELTDCIDELCKSYFYDCTKPLISHLENNKSSFLSDPIFIGFFYNWCQSNNIIEFYLINRQGSFITKDTKEKLIYFISMTESDKNDFYNMNDDAMDKISDLLIQVKEGKIIPFFGLNRESWEFELCEWKNHFYSAKSIKGKDNYFWTVIR